MTRGEKKRRETADQILAMTDYKMSILAEYAFFTCSLLSLGRECKYPEGGKCGECGIEFLREEIEE